MYKVDKISKDNIQLQYPSLYNEYTKGGYHLLRDDQQLGRVVCYINKYIGTDTLLLGGYAMVDNAVASSYFFDHITMEAKKEGYKKIIGPMNGSTWESYRFAHTSPDKSFLLEPQQETDYISLWETAGFETYASYYSSYSIHEQNQDWINEEKKLDAHFATKNLHVEKWKDNLSKEEWNQLAEFNNQAFRKNILFSPISNELFKKKYSQISQAVDTQFIYLVKEESNLVGLLFAYPNLKDTTEKSLILKTMARLPDSHLKGLGTWMALKFYNEASRCGYRKIIHALMQTDNASTIRSNEFGGEIFRHYSLYQKELI